jgi:hypothetical protein
MLDVLKRIARYGDGVGKQTRREASAILHTSSSAALTVADWMACSAVMPR